MKIETKYDIGDTVWFLHDNTTEFSQIKDVGRYIKNIQDFEWELDLEHKRTS